MCILPSLVSVSGTGWHGNEHMIPGKHDAGHIQKLLLLPVKIGAVFKDHSVNIAGTCYDFMLQIALSLGGRWHHASMCIPDCVT